MSLRPQPRPSIVADSIYSLLNPIPFGCFVAALIFDVIYFNSAEILWDKGAAWLIVFGLLLSVLPRLLNLTRVWITGRSIATYADKLDFWVNLFAIVMATLNAFVHSRDAYAVMPAGLWLSAGSVILISIGRVVASVGSRVPGGYLHE